MDAPLGEAVAAMGVARNATECPDMPEWADPRSGSSWAGIVCVWLSETVCDTMIDQCGQTMRQ